MLDDAIPLPEYSWYPPVKCWFHLNPICFSIIGHLNGVGFLEHLQWQPRGQAIMPLNFHVPAGGSLLLIMTTIALVILIGNLNCMVIFVMVNNLFKILKLVSLAINST